MAMWQIYSNPGSVVLKIDPESFIQMLERCSPNQEFVDNISSIHFGKVDYQPLSSDLRKVKIKALRKNNSYSHEKEVRLIVETKQHNKEAGLQFVIDHPIGLNFEIIAHPSTPQWQFDNLETLTRNFIQKKLDNSILENTIRHGLT